MMTYFDDLRAILVQSSEDEWWTRTTGSARHILAAVCFRETSENTHQLTGSVLLAPIGFSITDLLQQVPELLKSLLDKHISLFEIVQPLGSG
jgi:hypothetical protein